jgi:hypothetical protein
VSNADSYLYGRTDDGEIFYVHANSIGLNGRSVARLFVEIGGRYRYLQNEFILARIVSDMERGVATLDAYIVDMP